MPALLAAAAGLIAVAGIGQTMAGLRAVRRFATQPHAEPATLPAVTVLKPLYGDEPLLEDALASVCAQDYPRFQVVFGVHTEEDAAVPVVRRLQARFPNCAIDLVTDATPHGRNQKVANLINMLPQARHDLLVIADSDLHCAPDYLRRVVAGFDTPGTGLVTTLYAGLAATGARAARLGATAINHGFLPGALLARRLGREDCLGATMALRRETLKAIGGLHALVDHLADDNVLGQRVRALGLRVHLAATVPATTVPEADLPALARHELRWSRTILSLVPVAFTLSAIQYPLAWALLALALHPGWTTFGLFLAAWATRTHAASGIDTALGLVAAGRATPAPLALLPLRDLLSLGLFFASYVSDTVEWRGQMMHTRDRDPTSCDQTRPPLAAATPEGHAVS